MIRYQSLKWISHTPMFSVTNAQWEVGKYHLLIKNTLTTAALYFESMSTWKSSFTIIWGQSCSVHFSVWSFCKIKLIFTFWIFKLFWEQSQTSKGGLLSACTACVHKGFASSWWRTEEEGRERGLGCVWESVCVCVVPPDGVKSTGSVMWWWWEDERDKRRGERKKIERGEIH